MAARHLRWPAALSHQVTAFWDCRTVRAWLQTHRASAAWLHDHMVRLKERIDWYRPLGPPRSSPYGLLKFFSTVTYDVKPDSGPGPWGTRTPTGYGYEPLAAHFPSVQQLIIRGHPASNWAGYLGECIRLPRLQEIHLEGETVLKPVQEPQLALADRGVGVPWRMLCCSVDYLYLAPFLRSLRPQLLEVLSLENASIRSLEIVGLFRDLPALRYLTVNWLDVRQPFNDDGRLPARIERYLSTCADNSAPLVHGVEIAQRVRLSVLEFNVQGCGPPEIRTDILSCPDLRVLNIVSTDAKHKHPITRAADVLAHLRAPGLQALGLTGHRLCLNRAGPWLAAHPSIETLVLWRIARREREAVVDVLATLDSLMVLDWSENLEGHALLPEGPVCRCRPNPEVMTARWPWAHILRALRRSARTLRALHMPPDIHVCSRACRCVSCCTEHAESNHLEALCDFPQLRLVDLARLNLHNAKVPVHVVSGRPGIGAKHVLSGHHGSGAKGVTKPSHMEQSHVSVARVLAEEIGLLHAARRLPRYLETVALTIDRKELVDLAGFSGPWIPGLSLYRRGSCSLDSWCGNTTGPHFAHPKPTADRVELHRALSSCRLHYVHAMEYSRLDWYLAMRRRTAGAEANEPRAAVDPGIRGLGVAVRTVPTASRSRTEVLWSQIQPPLSAALHWLLDTKTLLALFSVSKVSSGESAKLWKRVPMLITVAQGAKSLVPGRFVMLGAHVRKGLLDTRTPGLRTLALGGSAIEEAWSVPVRCWAEAAWLRGSPTLADGLANYARLRSLTIHRDYRGGRDHAVHLAHLPTCLEHLSLTGPTLADPALLRQRTHLVSLCTNEVKEAGSGSWVLPSSLTALSIYQSQHAANLGSMLVERPNLRYVRLDRVNLGALHQLFSLAPHVQWLQIDGPVSVGEPLIADQQSRTVSELAELRVRDVGDLYPVLAEFRMPKLRTLACRAWKSIAPPDSIYEYEDIPQVPLSYLQHAIKMHRPTAEDTASKPVIAASGNADYTLNYLCLHRLLVPAIRRARTLVSWLGAFRDLRDLSLAAVDCLPLTALREFRALETLVLPMHGDCACNSSILQGIQVLAATLWHVDASALAASAPLGPRDLVRAARTHRPLRVVLLSTGRVAEWKRGEHIEELRATGLRVYGISAQHTRSGDLWLAQTDPFARLYAHAPRTLLVPLIRATMWPNDIQI